MEITATVQLYELLWMLSAIPGLGVWLANWIRAGRSLAAAKTLTPRNGRLLWARFARRLTTFMVLIEGVFLGVGLRAMALPSNPTASEASSAAVAALFVAMSLAVSWIGRDWRRVDELLLQQAARQRHLH